MVKVNIYLTTSKFAAYLMLAIGAGYSFLFKDPTVLLATFSAVSAVLIAKTFTTSKTDQARINNGLEEPEQSETGE